MHRETAGVKIRVSAAHDGQPEAMSGTVLEGP